MISNFLKPADMVNTCSKKHLCIVLFYILLLHTKNSTPLFAQTGTLDVTFGTNGIVTTSLDTFPDKGNAVVIQDDGKILVGGSTQSSYITSDFALLRYNTNGTLDNTFGTNGQVVTTIESRSEGQAVALQSDGKILLGGSSSQHLNLARFHADGSLDTTFGDGGTVITDVEGYYGEKCQSIAIQDDGKILVGGYGQQFNNDKPYFMIVRYYQQGVIDPTFGTNGVVIGNVGMGYDLQLQTDGSILLGGTSELMFAIERYTSNGILDNTFGVNGQVTTNFDGVSSYGHSIDLQSDGKIILGGNTSTDMALARYNTNGTLDMTFGVDGKVITPFGDTSKGHMVRIQDDGKVILSGEASDDFNFSNFALVRYNSDGMLDNTFGVGGKTLTPIGSSYSVSKAQAQDANGNIVLAGYVYTDSNLDVAIARYDGGLIVGINEIEDNGVVGKVYPNPFNTQTTIRVNTALQNASLTIYTVHGNIVQQNLNIEGQNIEFKRRDLPAGVYLYQVIENRNIITTGKLVISDK